MLETVRFWRFTVIQWPGNLKPSKNKSTEKIDGIVAMIMGIGLIIAQEIKEASHEVILA